MAGGEVETLEAFLAAFNRHDVDAVMEFFTDDCVMETPRGADPWGRRLEGKEQVRAGIEARFAGIPDIHYGDANHWAAGGFGVSRWTITGTDTSGARVEVRGCDLLELRGGKIARKDSYWKLVERGADRA
jgi:ketosteroid isomerase-like protein